MRQNLRVFWKLMNPQECVWEIRCRRITKTLLQEKETIHCSITIWFTSYASSCENSGSKSSGGQRMEIGENFGVEPDKNQKQERGDR